MELSEISVEFFFSFVFFFFFVYLRCHLLRFLFFFAFIHAGVYYYHHSSSPPSSPSPFCSSSCPPYCYCFSSIFVDSFLADVNECTSPTPVCGIHFNCIDTLGSYRCEYNYRGESCQSKKSMNYLFLYF